MRRSHFDIGVESLWLDATEPEGFGQVDRRTNHNDKYTHNNHDDNNNHNEHNTIVVHTNVNININVDTIDIHDNNENKNKVDRQTHLGSGNALMNTYSLLTTQATYTFICIYI